MMGFVCWGFVVANFMLFFIRDRWISCFDVIFLCGGFNHRGLVLVKFKVSLRRFDILSLPTGIGVVFIINVGDSGGFC